MILNKTMRGAEVPQILVVPVPATMVETIFKLFRLPLKLPGILQSNQKSFSSKNLPVKLKFKNLFLMLFTHEVMWKLMIIVWHWIEVDVKSKRKRRIIVTTVEWTMIQVGSFLLFHFIFISLLGLNKSKYDNLNFLMITVRDCKSPRVFCYCRLFPSH